MGLIHRLASQSGFLAACARAALISSKASAPGEMFYSLATTTKNDSGIYLNRKPEAEDSADKPIDNSKSIKWEIQNQSWIDEDTGISYIEITNTLTANILATDIITFHVQFSTDEVSLNSKGLVRDAFECKVAKQSTSSYWDVTPTDMYVRGTVEPVTAKPDFNNTIKSLG